MRTYLTLHVRQSNSLRLAPEPIKVEARLKIAHCYFLPTADGCHSAAKTSRTELLTNFGLWLGMGNQWAHNS